MHRPTIFALLLLAATALCCTRAELLPTANEDNPPTFDMEPIECDTCRYPVVMLHGFLASGDTYAKFHQLFTSNGYKPNLLYAFDWNSLNQFGGNSTVQQLDAFINKVLAQTGAARVRLMGHSAGGGVCYSYLNDPARAAKVDGYVHIGSSVQAQPAGPNGTEPTLNLWSSDDEIAQGGDIPGATNVQLSGKDHYEVATSAASFAAVYQFFHNSPPATLDITPESIVCIGGRVVFFGENTPLVNAKVEIYPVDPATGTRLSATPFETWFSDSLGYWGPTNVPANTTFEFVSTSAVPGQRVVHYFREGFNHLNSLVYLRMVPPPPSLAALLLGGLPNSENQSVLNIFSASQAVVHGRDTLTVAGSVLSTPQYASPAKTAITYFLYDDGDGATELSPVGLFGQFSFLNGVDMFFPTATPTSIPVVLNGRSVQLRNIKSSEGIAVAVFD
jgi:pimeloyl-ACP methyl ester carboxylesterase